MTRQSMMAWMVLAAVLLCLPGMAGAQEQRISPEGIHYVSGGVGDDERAALRTLAGQYNLKIEFAATQGNYMGDIRVTLKGPVSLDAVSEGPWFLVRVPAGSYTVTAVSEGRPKTQSVTVGASGQKTLMFRW